MIPYNEPTPEGTFATACRAIERATGEWSWATPMAESMRSCPVFYFGREDRELVNTSITAERRKNLGDYCLATAKLPFDECIVATQDFVAILSKEGDDLIRASVVALAENDECFIAPCVKLRPKHMRVVDGEWRVSSECEFHEDLYSPANDAWRFMSRHNESFRQWFDSLSKMISGPIIGILEYIDLPRAHLIEERPRKEREPGSKKIPRPADRPRMILIAPEDVTTVYSHSKSESEKLRSMRPHARRGYSKLLLHERYKEKRGQRIRVRPCWVGPGEWENNGKRYRIIVRGNDAAPDDSDAPLE